MKTLALDPSTSETGYCISEDGYILKLGTIKPASSLDLIEKLIYIKEEMVRIVLDEHIDDLILEDIYLKFFTSYSALAKLQGALITKWWEIRFSKPVLYGKANEMRRIVGIKGNAKKAEIMRELNKNLGTHFTNDNIADAVVLTLAYFKIIKTFDITKVKDSLSKLNTNPQKAKKNGNKKSKTK
jgi:Holliday junction resolvasome RuvABC endonuclease subunit